MCDQTSDPTMHDAPITESQREALAVLRLVDEYEVRVIRRAANLRALGFDDDEALRLAHLSWRVPRDGAA
jgi:hypothetical protein